MEGSNELSIYQGRDEVGWGGENQTKEFRMFPYQLSSLF